MEKIKQVKYNTITMRIGSYKNIMNKSKGTVFQTESRGDVVSTCLQTR